MEPGHNDIIWVTLLQVNIGNMHIYDASYTYMKCISHGDP
jgi:hypothetical protein